jgi:hypothetical protein
MHGFQGKNGVTPFAATGRHFAIAPLPPDANQYPQTQLQIQVA